MQREENIKQNSVDNKCIIYDAVAGELKKLEFDKLHRGIVKKVDFYVSCADFVEMKVIDMTLFSRR